MGEVLSDLAAQKVRQNSPSIFCDCTVFMEERIKWIAGLHDQVALVTGALPRYRLIYSSFSCQRGRSTGICARGEGLAEAAQVLREAGGEVFAQVCDVREREGGVLVKEAAESLGGIDIVINNVGGSAGGSLLDSSDSEWEETFQLNLFHAVRTTRAALPYLRAARGGSVVIITSISGAKPAPRAQYGCASGPPENFLAGTLAIELANTTCVLTPWRRAL